MKVVLVTYSDDRFEHKGGVFSESQEAINATAKDFGVTDLSAWDFESLRKTNFYKENEEFLNKDRFENGVPWKAFIILDQLKRIQDGDIVLYSDCGPNPLAMHLGPLIELCMKSGGLLFAEWGDRNRNWTKRDAFHFMDCDKTEFHNHVAAQNTWIMIEKNHLTLSLVREWLAFNLDSRIASYVPASFSGLAELDGHTENRGDQSIFALLAIKHGFRSHPGTYSGTYNKNINEFQRSLSLNRFEKMILQLLRGTTPDVKEKSNLVTTIRGVRGAVSRRVYRFFAS
jgi:hypothetical protein